MMEPPLPLTAFSEAQRVQAFERFVLLCTALEEGVSQAQVARTHDLLAGTVQRWITRYREQGLAGLPNARRSDRGKSSIFYRSTNSRL